jgi:hypothetical protein
LPFETGTTKSKLCADNVLRIRSKLQALLRHTPGPVVLLHVKPVGQGKVGLQAVVVVHAEITENNPELIC